MELRHLRYFVAVGEVLSFTKAATRMRVAQPALSRQVSDLEDELGVDWLRRTSHGVALTAEGKLFLEEVRGIFQRVDESITKVRAAGIILNITGYCTRSFRRRAPTLPPKAMALIPSSPRLELELLSF